MKIQSFNLDAERKSEFIMCILSVFIFVMIDVFDLMEVPIFELSMKKK